MQPCNHCCRWKDVPTRLLQRAREERRQDSSHRCIAHRIVRSACSSLGDTTLWKSLRCVNSDHCIWSTRCDLLGASINHLQYLKILPDREGVMVSQSQSRSEERRVG